MQSLIETRHHSVHRPSRREMLGLLALLGWGIPAGAQVFQNMAPAWNITQYDWAGTYGAAVSTADWDDDGWPDLTFGSTTGNLRAFRNLQGTGFEVVPLPFEMQSETKALLWVDLDNDGDDDLFIQEDNGRVGMIRNDGAAGFVDVTATSGIAFDQTETAGASFGDYDRDGDLDLYICRYIEFPPNDDPIHRNVLMRNDGNLTFTDVSEGSGATDDAWLSFQSLWWDYDLDGWQDIYVINDKTGPNALFRNLGDGTFESVAEPLGLDLVLDCMTASLGDFNHDGLQDMFNTGTPFGGDGLGSKLSVGLPDGTFQEAAATFGLDFDRFCWGAAWMDVDNDTDLDLFVTEHEFLQPYGINYLYENLGQGMDFSFEAFGESVYAIDYLNSHVVATADIDNNGWVDFVMHNLGNHAARIWMNGGFENGFQSIRIALEGTLSNRPAAGSLLSVQQGDLVQRRFTHVGENYLSQESEWELFGLEDEAVDAVTVHWPSGLVEAFDVEAFGLDPGTQHVLVEGGSACPQPEVHHAFCEGGGPILGPVVPAGATTAWVNAAGQPLPAGQALAWQPGMGDVTVVVLWQGQVLCSVEHVVEVVVLDADFDVSGAVDNADLLALLSGLGCVEACSHDLDGNGSTDVGDLLSLLAQYGTSCQ